MPNYLKLEPFTVHGTVTTKSYFKISQLYFSVLKLILWLHLQHFVLI